VELKPTRSAVGLAAVAAALAVPAADAQPPRPITQADSGKTIRIRRGLELPLRLSNRWVWSQPRLRSRAIELTPVYYFRNPGFQEWTIAARGLGRTTVTAVGRRADAAARRFHVTLVVVR
jgi:hypothetical protein